MTTPTTPPTAAPRLTDAQAAAFRSMIGRVHPSDLAQEDTLALIDLLERRMAAMRGRSADHARSAIPLS